MSPAPASGVYQPAITDDPQVVGSLLLVLFCSALGLGTVSLLAYLHRRRISEY